MKVFAIVLLALCFLPFICYVFYRISIELTEGFSPEEDPGAEKK